MCFLYCLFWLVDPVRNWLAAGSAMSISRQRSVDGASSAIFAGFHCLSQTQNISPKLWWHPFRLAWICCFFYVWKVSLINNFTRDCCCSQKLSVSHNLRAISWSRIQKKAFFRRCEISPTSIEHLLLGEKNLLGSQKKRTPILFSFRMLFHLSVRQFSTYEYSILSSFVEFGGNITPWWKSK